MMVFSEQYHPDVGLAGLERTATVEEQVSFKLIQNSSFLIQNHHL